MIEGALIGALVGAFVGLLVAISKIKTVKQEFNVQKGMTYEQVVAALGEPHSQTTKGKKIKCFWNLVRNGKPFKIAVTFVDNIAKSIG